jgi:hypothetical protein
VCKEFRASVQTEQQEIPAEKNSRPGAIEPVTGKIPARVKSPVKISGK